MAAEPARLPSRDSWLLMVFPADIIPVGEAVAFRATELASGFGHAQALVSPSANAPPAPVAKADEGVRTVTAVWRWRTLATKRCPQSALWSVNVSYLFVGCCRALATCTIRAVVTPIDSPSFLLRLPFCQLVP